MMSNSTAIASPPRKWPFSPPPAGSNSRASADRGRSRRAAPPDGRRGAAAGLVGAGAEQAAQALGRLHRVAVVQHPPVVEDDPAADPQDQVQGMGHEQDRAAALLELADLVQALALERLVADGQDSSTSRMSGLTWTATAKPSTYWPEL